MDPIASEKLAKVAANKESHPDNLACKNFDLGYYNGLSAEEKPAFLACLNSGIENADSGMGCYAMQPADYDRFNPFFKKVLAQYHQVAEDAKHVNNWSLGGAEGLPEGGQLDLTALGLPELSMRVRVGRNLKEFPLPGAMTKDDRVAMEAKMCAAFDVLKANPKYGGGYNSLTPGHANFVDAAGYQKLVDDHIMFKDMAADSYLATAGIASDWPFGRGCYVSEDREFIIWVGEEDHLRIMCMKKAALLNDVFDRLKEALDVVNGIEGLEFAHSEQYGMVTSCPTNLGTGMRASVHIPIPNLTSDGTDKKAKEICKPLGLSVRGTGGEHTPIGADGTCDISPSARFCITEAEIITALYNGLKLLKEKEAEAGGAAKWVANDDGGVARLLTDGMVSFVAGDQFLDVEPEHLPWDTPGAIANVLVPCGADNAGFGLLFGGAKDISHAVKYKAGVFIAGVEEGTPAAAMADQLVGMQVLSAGGYDMMKGTLGGMVRALQDVYDRADGSPADMALQLTPAQLNPAWAWGTVERTGERGLVPLNSISQDVL